MKSSDVYLDVDLQRPLRIKHRCGTDHCDNMIYGPTKAHFDSVDGILDYSCDECGAVYRSRSHHFDIECTITIYDTRSERVTL